MNYILGDQFTREYDACHYLLLTDKSYQNKTEQDWLVFKLKSNVEMNVFIYEGLSRSSAKKRIVDGNMQAQIGKEYRVLYNSSILVVAFPNKN